MVRTRFAPSPTGYMHIGNLRTALYEYLIAKSNNGEFILRIEDTDRERFVEGATDIIYKTLEMTGLKHDEGPDVGGDYGPYTQSERKSIYLPYAEELIKKGAAYYCFCTKERLQEMKDGKENRGDIADVDSTDSTKNTDSTKSIDSTDGVKSTESTEIEEGIGIAKSSDWANMYDRHCLGLRPEEVQKNLEAGVPYVIRQKMPREGKTVFTDVVFGAITVENSELEDQVLIKSDGLPTYNFANVVDDHLMGITHVVRGSEYLSSTPKYNLLYQGFGWDIPVYVHLPAVVKPGGQKLSKRAGDASFEDLLDMGYIVEAVVNYIALLGWSPKDNKEIFSLDELVECFDIGGISKSPSTFDYIKLNYFNAEHLRSKTPEEFHEIALPFIKKSVSNPAYNTLNIAKTLHQRVEVLNAIPEMILFYDNPPDYESDLFINKKNKSTIETARESLRIAASDLSGVSADRWNYEAIHEVLGDIAKRRNVKIGQIMWPVRIALSGRTVTPGGAVEIAEILGRDECIRRIEAGIEKL
ncbi:MAG: glutamate--tRNA ligase [Oscillospiraceae bacterium]|nr:glutamate--tRNA ligase [Oscillospiraceae bacterium]